ncbi:MAG TPA: Pvc16 family protein, partial [bacterium]|nr:Pvc16 family protein [bacterium]
MSASSVLGDVTKTLVELLKDEQNPLESFDITVQPPGEDIEATQKPKINLYLFRIEENDFAQNRDYLPVGSEKLHYPP